MIAVLLFAGLASANPKKEFAGGPSNGNAADPSALNQLARLTTTVPRQTTNTNAAGDPTPTTSKTTPTTTRPGMGDLHALGIGDSVMLGARSALQQVIPTMAVDAVKSRQFGEAVNVLGYYRSMHLLPPTIVIHLGTNGRITPGMFDQAMQAIGPGHQIYFLTPRVPRTWEAEDYATIQQGVKRWKGAHMLDWHAYSTCHDDWFVQDGFHLRDPGQRAYANFIRMGILNEPIKSSC